MKTAVQYGALLVLLTFCGCQTSRQSRYSGVISAYDRGDAVSALLQLEHLAEKRGTEPDITSLDRAIVHLLAAQPDSTMRELKMTRRRLDHLEQIDLSEQTVSALNDDSFIAWSGRKFERRMVDNLQILASLLRNHDDSFALASRGMNGVHKDERDLNRSQETPESDKPETVSQSAPAPARYAANRMTTWLAAAVTSERIQEADATDRLIQEVAAWGPSGDAELEALQALGTRVSRNSGTLQVVTFAGRISPWESERAIPTTAALLVADRILSVTADHSLPATNSPVLMARPVHRCYTPKFLTHVLVAGRSASPGRVLVDLNAAAWDCWQTERDQQLARAVIRRVVKKGALYGAKNVLGIPKGSTTDLLLNLAGMFWESGEQADLRQWNLLPAAVEVAQMELPAGNHRVQLQVNSANQDTPGPPADQLEIPVTVEDGRNTFVVCFRPHDTLVGVQSSTQAGG